MDTYLTVAEVAAVMGVNKQTAYRLVWGGLLPWINIAQAGSKKARVRVRRSAVDRFMAARERAGRAA